jgi:PAS domain S-box-containing protein
MQDQQNRLDSAQSNRSFSHADQELLHSIYTGIEEAIAVVDVQADGTLSFRSVNPAYEAMRDCSLADLRDRAVADVFPPEIAAPLQHRYQTCIETQAKVVFEEYIHAQDKQIWWLTSLQPLLNADQQVYRIISTSFNITRRHRAENEVQQLNQGLELRVQQRTAELEAANQAKDQLIERERDYLAQVEITKAELAESERRYRSVINSIKEVVFQMDVQGNWTFLSPSWTDTIGYSVEDSLGTSSFSYIHEEHLPQYRELFQQLVAEQQESFRYEGCFITKSGENCWLEIYVQLNQTFDGTVLGMSGSLYDLTDRKQFETALKARAEELTRLNAVLLQTTSRLEQRNQELDQFAYVASHDLKAPLRAIANLSAWLEEDLGDQLPEENQHQMQLLRGRVHRMEALIDGILEYSRVGRKDPPISTFSVADLLDDVIDSLAPPEQFTVNMPPDLPTLTAKQLRLRQVFANLMSNAIKYNDKPEGRMDVTVQDQGAMYEFAVADNGPGIEPRYHQKIFSVFQTLQARDKVESTGIGLSIVKKIIETEGGSITVESEIGQGCTFRFTWPKHPATEDI